MRIPSLIAAALLLVFVAPADSASVARAAWDNRCEECHGDPDKFAAKYLWIIEGQLQGRHHVDDLRLFLSNHYAPEHLLDRMLTLLSERASTLTRFETECSECHGTPESFVRKSIVTQGREMIGVMSSTAVGEYLESHRELSKDDAEFFTRLLQRVARIIYPN